MEKFAPVFMLLAIIFAVALFCSVMSQWIQQRPRKQFLILFRTVLQAEFEKRRGANE